MCAWKLYPFHWLQFALLQGFKTLKTGAFKVLSHFIKQLPVCVSMFALPMLPLHHSALSVNIIEFLQKCDSWLYWSSAAITGRPCLFQIMLLVTVGAAGICTLLKKNNWLSEIVQVILGILYHTSKRGSFHWCQRRVGNLSNFSGELKDSVIHSQQMKTEHLRPLLCTEKFGLRHAAFT